MQIKATVDWSIYYEWIIVLEYINADVVHFVPVNILFLINKPTNNYMISEVIISVYFV